MIMVSKEDVLKELSKDRNYEEEISKNILYYFLDSLDEVDFLTNEEKETIISQMKIIRDESVIHKNIFNELLNYVLENGKDEY
jgi:hypothetical protein